MKKPRAKNIALDYQLKLVTLEKVSNTIAYLEVSISKDLEGGGEGDHISKTASKSNTTPAFLRKKLKECP